MAKTRLSAAEMREAFEAYGEKFGAPKLTFIAMSPDQRQAAAQACADAIKAGKALTRKELKALEPAIAEGVTY